jgi:crossover junction endonuclease EME1
MPGDIIDLVSPSPPLPKLAADKQYGKDGSVRNLAGAAAAARALSSATKPTEEQDWFTLSSDRPDTYSLPKRSLELPIASTRTITKPNSLSKSKGPPPKANDLFLSDDFDSTVNFDDSFARNEPTSKRRRVSSSPQIFLPKERPYKRSISSIEPSKTKPLKSRTAPKLKKTARAAPDFDPLVFTSPLDPYADISRKRKEKAEERSNEVWEISSDNEDSLHRPQLPVANKTTTTSKPVIHDDGFLSMTDQDEDDFPELQDFISGPKTTTSYKSFQALRKYNAREAEKKGSKVTKPLSRTGSGAKAKSAEAKALDKSKTAEEKARDKAKAAQLTEDAKAEEKERKRLAKEEVAREKELAKELAKVNTAKTDKKVSTPEMILELASAVDPVIKAQVEKMARPLQVDYKEWDYQKPIVRWKRKVTSQYNEELGHWEPIPLVVRSEDHILYVLEIKELVELAMGDEQNNLDAHVLRLKSQFPQAQLIYLIEGMIPWSRKNKGNKDKQFAAAVSSDLATSAPANSQRKEKIPDYVDEDIIEEALMQLQILHEALIHHTTVRVETAKWIIAFTQHISTIPYRYALCLEQWFLSGNRS